MLTGAVPICYVIVLPSKSLLTGACGWVLGLLYAIPRVNQAQDLARVNQLQCQRVPCSAVLHRCHA